MLADTRRELSRALGVLHEQEGVSLRASGDVARQLEAMRLAAPAQGLWTGPEHDLGHGAGLGRQSLRGRGLALHPLLRVGSSPSKCRGNPSAPCSGGGMPANRASKTIFREVPCPSKSKARSSTRPAAR
jgi:hypothetical protein